MGGICVFKVKEKTAIEVQELLRVETNKSKLLNLFGVRIPNTSAQVRKIERLTDRPNDRPTDQEACNDQL